MDTYILIYGNQPPYMVQLQYLQTEKQNTLFIQNLVLKASKIIVSKSWSNFGSNCCNYFLCTSKMCKLSCKTLKY